MAYKSGMYDSNRCALSLLDALRRQRSEDLALGLNTAAELGRSGAEDTAEGERIELLGGIASEIRELAASGGLEDADVYIGLLRHLAAPAAAGRFSSAAASIQRGRPSSDWN